MNEPLSMIFRVLAFLSIILLMVAIVKPEWIGIGNKQLNRTTIIAVAIGLLMIGLIGAGAVQFTGKKNTEAVNRGKMPSQEARWPRIRYFRRNAIRHGAGGHPDCLARDEREKLASGLRGSAVVDSHDWKSRHVKSRPRLTKAVPSGAAPPDCNDVRPCLAKCPHQCGRRNAEPFAEVSRRQDPPLELS